ncbi:MAG TPA: DUF3300 domain-containing protein [Gemmatimonadales bacterium]|jgi:hypothetical protein
MPSSRPILSFILVASVLSGLFVGPGSILAQSSDADMDKLMAPIALYPDALLAQVLTAATSPDQVTEFQKWLGNEKSTGSDLQQAAMDAGFDAAFASLAIFPETVKMLADNMDWTKEIGTAYLSSKDQVMASVQRLRAQAEAKGNLKTNEQQKVTTTTEGGTQTIVIEPANPQVVYVPQYDPQVIYVQQAPPPSSSGNAAAAAILGFGLGIAIGAAINNDYYGWGAWGCGWHGGGVYYHHTTWVVPVRPRYPYVRPVPGYRPRTNVYAPRNTNINVNVDNSRTNIGNKVNVGNKTNVGDRRDNDDKNANLGQGGAGTRDKPGNLGSSEARGRPSPGSSNVGGAPQRGGGGNSALGGYSSGSSTRAASSRGKSSVGASRGGGGRRR